MRLTNHDRCQIASSTVKATLEKRQARLAKKGDALFDAVIASVLGKHKAAFEALPNQFKHSNNWFVVNVGGQRHSINRTEPVPVPFMEDAPQIRVRSALAKRIETYSNEWADLKRDQRELATKMRQTLAGITTVKALLETWPELEPHTPAHLLSKKALPVVDVSEVKKALAEAA